MQRADIAGMRQPSMATVLEAVVGHWGAVFVSIGLLVSVLGAYLAWSLICAEVLFAAAKTQDMPAIFCRARTRTRCRSAALWMTNIVVQLIVITTYWSRDAFALMLNLTSAMALIPFLLVAAYGLMLANRRETYEVRPQERNRDLDHRGHRHALHDLPALCRRHEVHRAARRCSMPPAPPSTSGPAASRASRSSPPSETGSSSSWRSSAPSSASTGLATGYITI